MQGQEHRSNLQNDGHSSDLILCKGFAEAGNRVFLINNLDDDHKFKTLFYQLPQGCAKIYTEIVISQSPKNRAWSPVMQEEEEEEKTMVDEEEEWMEEEEDDIVDNVAKTVSMLDPDADGTSEQKGKPAEGNNGVQCLQFGSHCKMTISAQSNQLVIAKQDGSHNIVNISVEPSPSSSKMVVVMTSNPDNPDLEGLLVHEIDRDTDVLNISLTSLEAAIVGVRKGSVVMEIEVKSGQNMNPDWMSQVLQTILKDILTPDVLGETKLQVDINTLNVIPKEKLGDYVLLLDPERKHETCVKKEKYQALQNRLEATQNKMKESENVRVVQLVNHTHSSGGTIVLVSGPPVHLQDKLLA
ncbi:uncharacterized protein LOC124147219 isoform X2 [Haliotis rufescens]|uniref:uncharacterized protein LOC124147219 isoform X2 n=1 Tax=Haliotis rufescens TaxID=6454 RepID=UPI00201F8076|nr:uncharacterized protein LOC124147219 isoform X2 [Haliotis rufescens]